MIKEHKVEVRFADIDAMGHVNNAVYLSYFEQARIALFDDIVGRAWDWEVQGFLLARNEIDYMHPVFLTDDVRIKIFCDNIGNSSLTLSYEVYRKGLKDESHSLCTKGKSIMVCFDYHKQQKIAVPEVWRKKLIAG